jgi:hypothetical protein
LKTRKRTDAAGNPRQATEIIVDNFIFLDPRFEGDDEDHPAAAPIKLDEHVDEPYAPLDTSDLASAENHPTF